MPSKPNVIVFFTDQQRWDTTGLHGNPLGLTPNFDRLASQGTHVANSFTCQPVCGPARSCLQTGLYATNTGVFRNGIPLKASARTLAHFFGDAGYTTGYIGKWHLGTRDPLPQEEQGGYQTWLGANVLEFVSEPYRTIMYDREGREHFLPGYRVDGQTDAAIRWVHDHREEPFFLFLSYLEPHHQNHIDDYPPPTGYRERYIGGWVPPDLAALGGSTHQHLAGYYGMVRRLDEALGRLMDALRSLQLADNTIVLFTSDHGSHFKTRNSEYKRSGHESSIRVPTFLTGPIFRGGGHVHQLVSLIDLPPTLLDAAGIAVPPEMEGRSILPLLRGLEEDWPQEVFIQISEAEVGRAVRTRRWKYGVTAPHKAGNKDSGSEKYVESYLYDLEADPYELTNLIGIESHRKVAETMWERLNRRMVAAGEAIAVIEPAEARSSGQRRVSEKEAES
jgi:arylsulfatase A-like enzyme